MCLMRSPSCSAMYPAYSAKAWTSRPTASRRGGPAASEGGPSGRGWRMARSPRSATRRPSGCRSRGLWGSARRPRRGRSEARRSRNGRRWPRCPSSAPHPPRTGGSGRWRHRRCRRWRPCRAYGRTCPRSIRLAVLLPCALDLVRRRRYTPVETVRESAGGNGPSRVAAVARSHSEHPCSPAAEAAGAVSGGYACKPSALRSVPPTTPPPSAKAPRSRRWAGRGAPDSHRRASGPVGCFPRCH